MYTTKMQQAGLPDLCFVPLKSLVSTLIVTRLTQAGDNNDLTMFENYGTLVKKKHNVKTNHPK